MDAVGFVSMVRKASAAGDRCGLCRAVSSTCWGVWKARTAMPVVSTAASSESAMSVAPSDAQARCGDPAGQQRDAEQHDQVEAGHRCAPLRFQGDQRGVSLSVVARAVGEVIGST